MSRQLPKPRPDHNEPPTWDGTVTGVVMFALGLAAAVILLVCIVAHEVAA